MLDLGDNPKIEPDHQEQNRRGGCEVDKDRKRTGDRVVAQVFQLLEIFVMKNGGEELADLSELHALRLAPKRSMLDQRIQELGFANGDEPLACRGALIPASRRHCTDW